MATLTKSQEKILRMLKEENKHLVLHVGNRFIKRTHFYSSGCSPHHTYKPETIYKLIGLGFLEMKQEERFAPKKVYLKETK